ncbi:L-histidine N(alpha)-methyltransferase [Pseudonocardia humida]|uniref:L-histidine N(Alpha)-methyltransferase n=1 Tax=Pseudonocardia humida TaxID=2800819 RepID=A0ABT0ZYC8_9PSEU|nr:L-histidine N(alpha)-methyltransferase [Pseudonocardia humida]MCO1655755.1 L-histidine N(alpha)-methyltransferase [Pseudonocardia humida]
MVRPEDAARTVRVVPVDTGDAFWDDGTALRAALAEPVPRIPPVFGYDERGSQLFEAITELPTYYLTRVEWDLLRRHADDIAARLDTDMLAEMGSGSAKKTAVLLGAAARHRPLTYLPIDVSREMLEASGRALVEQVPGLDVVGLWGRYEQGLAHLRSADRDGRLVVAFLGSNMGNATDAERADLLADIAATLRPGDGFLFSVDLLKPADVLETAYNDPPGHDAFAGFRLNHLTHLNRRFGADFDVDRFRPLARFDPGTGMVEGHLHVLREQRVRLPGLDLELDLARGGSINVGFSAKFDRDRLAAEIAALGMDVEHEWIDQRWRYAIALARRR